MLKKEVKTKMPELKLYDNRYQSLSSVDWDFSDASVDSLANIHPYPARFINEIPKHLIEEIGCPEGTIILDPFCGSGTTLVEAQRHGFDSVGIDLNPIACLISRVKRSLYRPVLYLRLRRLPRLQWHYMKAQ